MDLTVNGERRLVADDSTLAELLDSTTGRGRGVAAAVDGEVVPRSGWPAYRLRAGQSVEILTAVQGG